MSLIDSIKNLFSSKNLAEQNRPEAVQSSGDFSNFIAAKVVEWQKHPNADRLRVVKLDIGDGKILEPIVCGASNFDNGDIIVLALPGAKIAQNIHSDGHEPFVLGKAKIRGIESQGMICAAFELGLSKDPGTGIMHLKSGTRAGSQFSPEMIE